MKELKDRDPDASACILLNNLYKKKAQELPYPIHPDNIVIFDELVYHVNTLSPIDRDDFVKKYCSSRTCVLLLHTPVLSDCMVPVSLNFFSLYGAKTQCPSTAIQI